PAVCILFVRMRPPRSTPFPYTTLFRSWSARRLRSKARRGGSRTACNRKGGKACLDAACVSSVPFELDGASRGAHARGPGFRGKRSEEHTSELQSRENLVCRLLLEKKKQ